MIEKWVSVKEAVCDSTDILETENRQHPVGEKYYMLKPLFQKRNNLCTKRVSDKEKFI